MAITRIKSTAILLVLIFTLIIGIVACKKNPANSFCLPDSISGTYSGSLSASGMFGNANSANSMVKITKMDCQQLKVESAQTPTAFSAYTISGITASTPTSFSGTYNGKQLGINAGTNNISISVSSNPDNFQFNGTK